MPTNLNEQNPHSVERLVRARLGPPYEDNGNCELCNKSGPVWMCEEAETWNQMPFCAECIENTQQRPNDPSSATGRETKKIEQI